MTNFFQRIIFIILPLLTLGYQSADGQKHLTSKTVTKSEKINWITLEEAVEQNKKQKKKILIDLYTDWCGWCKVMDKNTFSNVDIARYINKTFYAVKLDAEYKNEISFKNKVYNYISSNRRGYNEFALMLTGGRLSYPSVIFIDEDLNVIQPIQGYQEPESFMMISKYFGEDRYKDTPWTVFQDEYKK